MSERRLKERGIDYIKIGPACLRHWKIRSNKKSKKMAGYGFMNIEPHYGSEVMGILYKVRQSDLDALDKFEGYPNHYQRTFLPVHDFNLYTFVNAIVYIAKHAETTSEDLPITNEYREYLLEGLSTWPSELNLEGVYKYLQSFKLLIS